MKADHTRLLSTGVLVRAVATGLAGAALSAERRPGLTRGLGLATAAALGGFVALASSGTLPLPREEGDEAPAPALPGPVAAALGLGTFALAGGVNELGLRGQGRLERWATRTNGHPRLTVGVVAGALSLAVDVADRAASRR